LQFDPGRRKNLLHRSKHWNIYLADLQDYIGSCIVVSAVHYEALSDLPIHAWAELKEVINVLEAMLKDTLGAAMLNWSCLMNNAYKSANPAPHIHFLVRPRYRNPVSINGHKFRDNEFAHHYARGQGVAIDEETRTVLYEKLKDAIGVSFH